MEDISRALPTTLSHRDCSCCLMARQGCSHCANGSSVAFCHLGSDLLARDVAILGEDRVEAATAARNLAAEV